MKANETISVGEHAITCRLDDQDNKYYVTDLDDTQHKSQRAADAAISKLEEENLQQQKLEWWGNLTLLQQKHFCNYVAISDFDTSIDDWNPDYSVKHLNSVAHDLSSYVGVIDKYLEKYTMEELLKIMDNGTVAVTSVSWTEDDYEMREICRFSDLGIEEIASELSKMYDPFDCVILNGTPLYIFDLDTLECETHTIRVKTQISVA